MTDMVGRGDGEAASTATATATASIIGIGAGLTGSLAGGGLAAAGMGATSAAGMGAISFLSLLIARGGTISGGGSLGIADPSRIVMLTYGQTYGEITKPWELTYGRPGGWELERKTERTTLEVS